MKAVHLKTEYLKNPVGIDISNPRLYWQCEEGKKQSAYRIVADIDGKEWDSGKRISEKMTHVPFEASVTSRNLISWKVKLWDEEDREGEWSEEAFFEMGLLKAEDWRADWITAGESLGQRENTAVDCFQKKFSCQNIEKARLYVTACGTYEIALNGKKAGDRVLAPGATDYNRRVQYQVYDVTDLLHNGENELTAELANGWQRLHIRNGEMNDVYGTETKLLVQLEIKDETGNVQVIGSDETWNWSDNGPVLFADNKGGEVVDARRKADYKGKARVTEHSVLPSASNNVPVREQERLKPVQIVTPSGEHILDFGQNIAGIIEFETEARAGQKIILELGEYLEEGEFTQKNINPDMVANGGTINPFQMVCFICKEGRNHYKTRFAVFGFQYVRVLTEIPWKPEQFTAIATYSDMKDTMEFSSSNELLNRFVECTRWSGRNNTLDVPTDCPQRERLGWTGDAQIFYNTAAYLFDYAAFGRKYIHDMEDAQRESGSYTQIAPRGGMQPFMTVLDGSVGWSDAGVYIPYRMWKMYGDDRILREHYPSMVKYAEFMIGRCGKENDISKKIAVSEENKKYLVTEGLSYGEWIEPKEIVAFDMMELSKPHVEESTAYTAWTMKYMAEMAEYLGRDEDREHFQNYAEGCRRAYQELVTLPEYSMDTDRQAKLVRPLYMGLLNLKQEEWAKDRLLKALDHFHWRVGTGFLSTPFLLFVLEDIGLEYAYRLLENEEVPGWLAMPKNGATTIWEDWEGIYAEPQVASLNHYSKGAVCEWLFSEMCGVKVEGENTFLIAPKPGGNLSFAKMKWDSLYGTVQSNWKREGEKIIYEIVIPANTSARLLLHGEEHILKAGTYRFVE